LLEQNRRPVFTAKEVATACSNAPSTVTIVFGRLISQLAFYLTSTNCAIKAAGLPIFGGSATTNAPKSN